MTGVSIPRSNRVSGWFLAALVLPVLATFALWYLGQTRLLILAAGGVVALVGAATVLLQPRYGVYFLIVYVYAALRTLAPAPVAAPVMVLSLLAIVLRMLRGDHNRMNDPAFLWATGLFFVISAQSMLVAHDIKLSLTVLSTVLKSLLFIFMIVQTVRTFTDLRNVARMVFWGAFLTIPLGLMAIALGLEERLVYIGTVNVIRFDGLHDNPNRAGAHMCAAIPLGIFAVRYAQNRLERYVSVAGLITLIAGLFATFSRGAIFPFGLVVMAVLIREFRSGRAWLAIIALLALGVLLTPRFYWDRITTLTESSKTMRDYSLALRLTSMKTAWALFTQNPWTGIGLGNFPIRGAYDVWKPIDPHNTYLEILVGSGVFGLAAYLSMILATLRRLWRGTLHRWQSQPDWARSLCFYLMLSGLAPLASAMFDTMSFRYVIWVPLACGLVVGRLLAADTHQTDPTPSAH